MARFVALLRGVNVGGNNRVPMADLRRLFISEGHRSVATYLQSGNVVFTANGAVDAQALESAIARRLGIETTVVLRSPDDLKRVVAANPFPAADLSHLHVGFMAYAPPPNATAGLDAASFQPEQFALVGLEIYLHLPNGMGRAKLPPLLDRKLKVPTTVRNWNTVNKLIELAATGGWSCAYDGIRVRRNRGGLRA
ncbi:MAG TPA: DUF1697 domain-containing protein [Acidimicrobiales bacterium]|nr:DUF1697 domain-containing protein [Acidimicrobiales bacterium]